jgi:hypothetical protein
MWKQDLEALLKAWPSTRLISTIKAVPGGIAITDTEGVHWHYNHNEGTLTRLSA